MATKKPRQKTATKTTTKEAATASAAKADPAAGRRGRPKDPKDQITLDAIARTAAGIHKAINAVKRPELKMPVRSLSNVTYDVKKGYFELGKDKKVRTLSVATVKTLTGST